MQSVTPIPEFVESIARRYGAPNEATAEIIDAVTQRELAISGNIRELLVGNGIVSNQLFDEHACAVGLACIEEPQEDDRVTAIRNAIASISNQIEDLRAQMSTLNRSL